MIQLSLLSLLAFIALALAHTVPLKYKQSECFYEDLHKGDQMSITFQVGDRTRGTAGNLGVMFWVQKPNNQYQVSPKEASSGQEDFTAPSDGRYVYCFKNDKDSSSSKEVSFNIHGIVYVPESEFPKDPLEKEVREIVKLVSQAKDEQAYIIIRERTHRNTAENTNSRVARWGVIQVFVIIGHTAFQVWWFRRYFEVKR